MIDLQRYLPAAQKAQAVISQVLDSRPGTSSEYIQGWVLRGTPQNDVFFYAVLDASRIPQPEPFARATHQISSALGGQRVYWGNSTGFRFAVVLTPAKRLPRQIELPTNLPAGRAMIGLRPDGQAAGGKWGDLKHIIVVGYTGSGKSVTIRSLVYQPIQHCRIVTLQLAIPADAEDIDHVYDEISVLLSGAVASNQSNILDWRYPTEYMPEVIANHEPVEGEIFIDMDVQIGARS